MRGPPGLRTFLLYILVFFICKGWKTIHTKTLEIVSPDGYRTMIFYVSIFFVSALLE